MYKLNSKQGSCLIAIFLAMPCYRANAKNAEANIKESEIVKQPKTTHEMKKYPFKTERSLLTNTPTDNGKHPYTDSESKRNTVSNSKVSNATTVPPYSNTFDDKSSLDLFTIINANEDNKTWGYYQQTAEYLYSTVNYADDWLITPGIKLEAGKEYTVKFQTYNWSTPNPEKIEVKYGNGNTVDALTNVLLEETVLSEGRDKPLNFFGTISSDKEQTVNIGFHAMSEKNRLYLRVDNISVGVGADFNAPDTVSKLKIVPGAKGAESATVLFTLPSKTLNGTELTEITKAEIYRDGTLIHEDTDGLTPGKELTYADVTVKTGLHSYTVLVYNSKGVGREMKPKTAYIGVDIPAAPQASSTKFVDNTTSVTLSWSPILTGEHGGYVNPKELLYTLYNIETDSYGRYTLTPIDSVKGVESYVFDMNTNEGEQQLIQYGLAAKNEIGQGGAIFTSAFISGKAHETPFIETFPEGDAIYSMWWTSLPNESQWGMMTDVSTDDDGGSAAFAALGGEGWLNSGKISLAGLSKPSLAFATRPDSDHGAKITVFVSKPDGTQDSLSTIDFSTLENDNSTWIYTKMSLDNYKSLPYIIVKFLGDGVSTGIVYLDDIQVRDIYENDLSVSMTAPTKLKKSESGMIVAKVRNIGEKTVSDYTVELYDGKKLIDSKEADENLASFATKEFAFEYKPTIFNNDSIAELKVYVKYTAENVLGNNTDSAKIELIGSNKPSPTTAKAEIGKTGVSVSWTAPNVTSVETTEDFESYDAWSIDRFGEWIGIDGDKGETGTMFREYTYAHQYDPYGFILFEPKALSETILETNPGFTPHSGQKYVAAFYSKIDDDFVDADNWLISPLQPGDKQTVRFFAKNSSFSERLELMYSEESTDTSTFVAVDTVTVDVERWTEFSFEIPKDAKYFAIRHISDDGGFGLLIDDITYMADAGSVTGYNIYRDGEIIKNVGADVTSYTDTTAPNGSHTYAVTAVYVDGESAPTVAEPVIVTSIAPIDTAESKTFTVYSFDGTLIGSNLISLKNLNKGIYIVNNKKVVLK